MTTDELINQVANGTLRNRIFVEAVDVAISEFASNTSNTDRKAFLTTVFEAKSHEAAPIDKLVRWIVVSNRDITVAQLDTASQNSTTVQTEITNALTTWFGAIA